MKNQIYPCLWFEDQAEEAAQFYGKVFKNGALTGHTPIVVTVELSGQKFMCINGGPQFKPNPTMSFYTICKTEEEVQAVWNKLLEGGQIIMPLDKYDWSEKYGWIQDRYGVSWQVTLGKISDLGQKFTPALMFAGDQFGRAEEAINYYIRVFKDSTIHLIHRYPQSDEKQKGRIAYSQFSLLGQQFIAMDSALSPDLSFTEGLSLVVECDTQVEIDYYWYKLSQGGEEGQCGWLKDKFGFSWQIVPAVLSELMTDASRAPRVTEAFLKMKKFDIEALLQA